jgi:hypothetical protein
VHFNGRRIARSIYDAQNIIEIRRRKIWAGKWGPENEDGWKMKTVGK